MWMERKKTREEKEEMDCNNERLESEWRRSYANFWTKDVTKYADDDHLMILDYRPL